MGRLGPQEKRFLAEILYGFITKSYMRCARVHFEAGYVPPHQDVATFAQALRAIGEPLQDRTAEEISMGRVLGQLFEVTEMFDMRRGQNSFSCKRPWWSSRAWPARSIPG